MNHKKELPRGLWVSPISDYWKDLKSRSLYNLEPHTTKGSFKGAPFFGGSMF